MCEIGLKQFGFQTIGTIVLNVWNPETLMYWSLQLDKFKSLVIRQLSEIRTIKIWIWDIRCTYSSLKVDTVKVRNPNMFGSQTIDICLNLRQFGFQTRPKTEHLSFNFGRAKIIHNQGTSTWDKRLDRFIKKLWPQNSQNNLAFQRPKSERFSLDFGRSKMSGNGTLNFDAFPVLDVCCMWKIHKWRHAIRWFSV